MFFHLGGLNAGLLGLLLVFSLALAPQAAVLEAENAILIGAETRDHAGASGGKRVIGIDQVGDAVRFTNVPTGRIIKITYSLNRTIVCQAGLYIDGRRVDTLYYLPTRDWNKYDTLTYYHPVSGSVEIRIDPSDHEINLAQSSASLDKIEIIDQAPPKSTRVQLTPQGRLQYFHDAQGNRIPDFSMVGYEFGEKPIPDVPTRVTISPISGDNTAHIQAALDQVAALPLDASGFRGAVLLTTGTYPVAGSVRITASGVVLRGVGPGANGTVLHAIGNTPHQRTLVQVAGTGAYAKTGTTYQMTDNYVPVGATSFNLNTTAGLSVGSRVIVHRPSTAEWIHDIGMDQIPPRSDGGTVVQWAPGSKDLLFDRVVTRIQGNRIWIDAPVCNAFETKYGGGTVYRYTFAGRIRNVGVENLRGTSEYASATDENHAWSFLTFDRMEHGWARFISTRHFGFQSVAVNRYGRNVTVQDCEALDPISTITGSRRYPFHVSGQLNLFQRCYASHQRHDFAMSSTVAGPNVFVDGSADTSYADTGPHHRWSVGSLWDNLRIRVQDINIRNRGNSGTGHGWAGANQVVWNSHARSMNIQNPPTAQNWSIGSTTPSRLGNGIWESHNVPVEPRSLYRAQLAERLRAMADASHWHWY